MANLALLAVDNKTMLVILMVTLIVFLVLLTILAIVFIVALRKRAPVIKIVMAPPATSVKPTEQEEEAAAVEDEEEPEEEQPEPEDESVSDVEDDSVEYVTEGKERVRYDRSMTAKVIQMKDESKEWYSQIKNELLSYQKVKVRMSWKRETFRLGREPLARLIVRGKTLCLMLAVEPAGFVGTKFTVEDVSGAASNADTPCQYRIKSSRRAKYAKELINIVMKELGVRKDPNYEAQDYYQPFEGTMGLMEKGLIKRVVSNLNRVFEVRELSEAESAAAKDKEGE